MSAEPDPTDPVPDPPTRVPLALEKVLVAAAMAAMAIITFANVTTRYLTDVSLAFTEEYSVALMVVVALLGTSLATAAGRHVRIGTLVDGLPPPARRGAEVAALSAGEKRAVAAATRPVYVQWAGAVGADLVRKAEAAVRAAVA